MTNNYKAVGNNLIVKITKKKSSLDLSAMSGGKDIDVEQACTVVGLGTKCTMDIKVGHEIVVKHNTLPILIEESDDYDLLLIPENSVAYISNWKETDDEES